MDEIKKVYYRTSEVAKMIGERSSTVRYWSSYFRIYHLKGRSSCLYRRKEVALFHEIKNMARFGDIGLAKVKEILSQKTKK